MPDRPSDRTPEEIAAVVRKLDAEARAAEAEATRTEVEMRRELVAAEKAEREARDLLSKDECHHLYRFTDAVSEASAYKCIDKLTQWHRQDPDCSIEIVFDSPGGSVHDGFALFDHIRYLSDQGHHITTGTVGMAASMAGILMQAGDHRWMGKEAWYLIHRAGFGAMGKTFEVEDRVKLIKRIENRIISIFVDRTDLTKATIQRRWNREDWWLDSDECLKYGLVDEVRG